MSKGVWTLDPLRRGQIMGHLFFGLVRVRYQQLDGLRVNHNENIIIDPKKIKLLGWKYW